MALVLEVSLGTPEARAGAVQELVLNRWCLRPGVSLVGLASPGEGSVEVCLRACGEPAAVAALWDDFRREAAEPPFRLRHCTLA
jgi:hypothetical protein